MRKPLLSLLLAVAAASAGAADGIKVLNDDAHFAEGPIFYAGKLYYVEYDRNSVTTWDGARNTVFWSKPGCGPSAVIRAAGGEFLAIGIEGQCEDGHGLRIGRGRIGLHGGWEKGCERSGAISAVEVRAFANPVFDQRDLRSG